MGAPQGLVTPEELEMSPEELEMRRKKRAVQSSLPNRTILGG
jgi:hypothetical protein